MGYICHVQLIAEQIGRLTHQLQYACGPDLLNALKQPDIEDLALNPDGRLWQLRRLHDWECVGEIDELSAYAIVTSVAAIKHRPLNESRPVLETTFPLDNSRFEAVLPPVTRRPIFSLRVKRSTQWTFADYEQQGVLTHAADPLNVAQSTQSFIDRVQGRSHADILRAAAIERRSVLYVGQTGSGKTTLSDVHLGEIGRGTTDRVVYIEDTPELVCEIPNSVDLLATEEVSILDCVRVAMRLRPKRIVVGEVRGAEAHALIKAWATGHPGGICTVHADDAYSGLLRVESLVAESTAAPQQDLIAQAIHLVCFIDEEPRATAGRKVRELIAVTGYSQGRYQFTKL